MRAKVKLLVAVGILLALAFGLWGLMGSPEAPLSSDSPERATRATEQPTGPGPTGPADDDLPTSAEQSDPKDEGTKSGTGATERVDPKKPVFPGGAIAGRVVLPAGQDPALAQIVIREILSRKDATDRKPFEATLPVGPQAGFHLDGLAPGRYSVEARHPRLAPATALAPVTTEAGVGDLVLELRPGGALVVAVLDAQDQPRPDQELRVTGPCRRTGKTDGNGELLLELLPAGTYAVVRSVESHQIKRMIAVLPGETARLVLREGATLTGTILGPDGKAPARAIVRLRPVKYGPQGYESFQATMDQKGRYCVKGVPAGVYRVDLQVLSPESYVSTSGQVTLAPGEEKEFPIQVRATVLGGRITRADDGRPLLKPEVQISARRARIEDGKVVGHIPGSHAMTWVKDDGYYEFKGLEPGMWEVWIYPFSGELADTSRVVEVVSGGRAIDADFVLRVRRLGTLRLRILEPDGKVAAKGVSFTRVVSKNGKDWYVTLRGKRGEDGRFDFALEEGERRVSVHRDGYRTEPKLASATVKAGEVVEAEVRLVQLGEILVTVVDEAGTPLEGATVFLKTGKSEQERLPAKFLGKGVYRVRTDPGKRRIVVQHEVTESLPVDVVVEAGKSTAVRVEMGP